MMPAVRKLVSHVLRNDVAWRILNATLIRAADYAKRERGRVESVDRAFIIEALRSIAPDGAVKHGPFEGMRYPAMKSVCSSLAPKLLGSYEKELHPTIERLCQQDYSEIVTVGCAEGYYAVGLAMRIKTARVFVYDIDSEAIRLCLQMARMNNVAERFAAGSFCDANTLRSLPLTKRALIVSDCEGYEEQLFRDDVVRYLAGHDLLVEVHDCINIEISGALRRRFARTHAITVVRSLDDITKAQWYDFEELRGYDLSTRRKLLAEHRPSIMEWFYMTALTPGCLR